MEPGPLVSAAESLDFSADGDTFAVAIHPNPVREDGVWIDMTGSNVDPEALRVEVFDLSGRQVWAADEEGAMMWWPGENRSGERLANGVYLMSIRVHVAESWIPLPIEKVAILR